MEQGLKNYRLLTPYGEKLTDDSILPEYPRPQFVRNSYLNLNGIWDYAICDSDELPQRYDGTIRVPFAPESILSTVEKTITAEQTLFYHRSVTLADGFNQGIVRLHFGAVDQCCKVYVNNQLVKEHVGGYLPFYIDLSGNQFDIVVAVKDCTDQSWYSRGKQSSNRGGIWYTPFCGIWQTVWMESFAEKHIESIKYEIDYDHHDVNLSINGSCSAYQVEIFDEGKTIYKDTVSEKAIIHIDNMKSWSPESPFLYRVKTTSENDCIESYFAMRKFSCGKDGKGIQRIMLNNKPYFHKGVLDQGYYSDGVVTPASYKQMEDDILLLKEMGFNTIRKHIKIEPMYFYYLCDKLGMLLWQDMVNGGGLYNFIFVSASSFFTFFMSDSRYKRFARESVEGRANYEQELEQTINLLYNVPSLALWVPFNEAWGQFDALRIEKKVREMDQSRLIDHASGWYDQGGGDLYSKHLYFTKIKKGFRKDKRVWALTEYGGYTHSIVGHSFNDKSYGYRLYHDEENLMNAFAQLHNDEIIPLIEKGLSATIYTQLSDVEDENNGLITYDRKQVKFDKNKVRNILDQMIIND